MNPDVIDKHRRIFFRLKHVMQRLPPIHQKPSDKRRKHKAVRILELFKELCRLQGVTALTSL